MRLLEQKKVAYQHYTYESEGAISGVEVAALLQQNPAQVFKTLGNFYPLIRFIG